MGAEKDIVIVMFKYSVIVKGIERKLDDCGYNVTILAEEFDRIKQLAEKAILFILYLPKGITENQSDLDQLAKIHDMIQAAGRDMILIGEKDDPPRLTAQSPHLLACAWVNRPVRMDDLEDIVEETLKNSDKKKILIVDDDPAYAKMAQEWIKDEYQAYSITVAKDAVPFLLKKPVDLILLDYEMPVMDGPQVFQMLRQEPATRNIPVVFLTGISTDEGSERIMALHPDGFVLKSATKETLLDYLRKKLQNGKKG
ncbi:MAG: response regulator [Schwartzia sp.]|nr:response regulator [Schwartzia sp. (in: firmicutes)]